jgi:transposase-like protein
MILPLDWEDLMVGFEVEVERRAEAVRLVRDEGLTVVAAAARVGRSRQWLTKWLDRVDAGEGLQDRSRVSATSFRPLGDEVAALVLEYRNRLEADPMASSGGLAILAAMERDGLVPPALRSIERILTIHGRSRASTKKRSRSTVPVLPLPKVKGRPGVWQQGDWVQNRYLTGGVRYDSLQTIDVGSQAGIARQYPDRKVLNVVECLIEHVWPVLSIPHAFSVDNAFSSTTHRDNPWTLFIRTCLFFGVEPVISPPYELGWTNTVEGFNNLWQARTIAQHRYDTLKALAAHSTLFNTWANHQRPILDPGICGTRYPAELTGRHHTDLTWPPDLFITDHQDSKGRLNIPLTTGRVTFLRRVKQRHITIAHRPWHIDLPDHALVIASITTNDATLTLRHQAQTITTHDYPIHLPISTPYNTPQPTSIYHHA